MKKNLIFILFVVVKISASWSSQNSSRSNAYNQSSRFIGSGQTSPRSSSPTDQEWDEAIQSLRDLRYCRPATAGTYVDQRQQAYWKRREQETMIEKEEEKLKKRLYPNLTPQQLAKVKLTPEQHEEAVRQAELEWY